MKTNDEFRAIVDESRSQIQLVYDRFSDKKPIIEIDLPDRLIRAFSLIEYFKTLSPSSRKVLKREYARAISKDELVLFIRDNETKTLKSCRLAIEAIDYDEPVPGAWVSEQDPRSSRRAPRTAVRRPRASNSG